MLLFCSLFTVNCSAQIDTLYNQKPGDRVIALLITADVHLFSLEDSTLAYNKFDTLIQGAKQRQDERIRWYSEFLKMLYRSRKAGNISRQVEEMQKISGWVESCPMDVIKASYKHQLGYRIFFDKRPAEGLALLLQAEDMFKKTGLKNVPEISYYLYELANVYYTLGDYKKSIQYAELSEANRIVFYSTNISNLNTEALAYKKLNNLTQAKAYFFKSLNRARNLHETVWVSIVSGNLGRLLMMQNQYKEALPYLLTDYSIDHAVFPAEAFYAALDVAGCYAKTGNAPMATVYFKKGMKLRDSIDVNDLLPGTAYYRSMYQYYSASGNIQLAFRFADSLITVADSLNAARNANLLSSTQTRVDNEDHLSALALEQVKAKNSLVIKNTITGSFSAVLFAALLLVYGRYRSVIKNRKLAVQEKQIANIEKQAAEERLHYAEGQLTGYIQSIAEKNSLIEKINARLVAQEERKTQAGNAGKLQQKAELLEFTILTDDDWERFKNLFNEVYPNFFNEAKKYYPALTLAETRLMALLKLNISHKEMSYITGVSEQTITKTKYRLRKKLTELNIDKDLEQFVMEL